MENNKTSPVRSKQKTTSFSLDVSRDDENNLSDSSQVAQNLPNENSSIGPILQNLQSDVLGNVLQDNHKGFSGRVHSIQKQVSVSASKASVDSISINQYQEWYDIIIKDDIESADIILKTITKSEQDLLLDSAFDFEVYLGFGQKEEINNKVNVPFHLAVVSGSVGVADIMLEYGINVTGVNNEGYNVLHSAVVTSFSKPKLEEEICNTIKWLLNQLNSDKVSELLFHENNEGLRPIEFAAQQGCLKIMRALLETKGHVTSETICGHGIYRMHDVTEYEIGDRHAFSPINLLAYLDVKKLTDPDVAAIILSPLFSDWITKKIKCNIPLIVFWFLLRLTFIVMFIVVDLDIGWLEAIHGNKSTEVICPQLSYVNMGMEGNIILLSLLVLYTVIVLCGYLANLIVTRRRKIYSIKSKDLHGKKTLISNAFFFKMDQFLLVIVVLLACIQSLDLTATNFTFNKATFMITDIARSFIPVLSLWSFCFFLQVCPAIGSSIISIQGMLIDLAKFMLLFVVMLLPFVHVFESFALANSEQGCIPEFESMYITTYTLFRMMLNIYDPSSLVMKNSFILYILHILYTFMVGVLLINFLIAMMSKKAAQIAEKELVVLKINQLALVDILENRLFLVDRLAKWLYKKLTKIAFDCIDNHVYIQSTVCRFSQLYEGKKSKKQYRFQKQFSNQS